MNPAMRLIHHVVNGIKYTDVEETENHVAAGFEGKRGDAADGWRHDPDSRKADRESHVDEGVMTGGALGPEPAGQ